MFFYGPAYRERIERDFSSLFILLRTEVTYYFVSRCM
jgi:hypothetical protein